MRKADVRRLLLALLLLLIATPVYAQIGGSSITNVPLTGTTTASSLVRVCEVVIGGLTGSALADGDDTPAVCGNKTGATLTITAVECYADATGGGGPTVDVVITGGASVLTGAVSCGAASFVSGTLSGTPTQANGGSLAANITTAGGTAKYLVIRITRTL